MWEGAGSVPVPSFVRGRETALRQALGLDLELDFELLGAASDRDAVREGSVRVELASRDELGRRWRPRAPRRISRRAPAPGRLISTIDADPEAGYLFESGLGDFWVAADGARIGCAPADAQPWLWQAYLTGQVLPLAAVLRGIEVFHASAVAGPRGAVAFAGSSTAGKTSIALHLLLRGARFVTDDVVAVSAGSGRLMVHPGVAVANVRESTMRLLPPAGRNLGRILGGVGPTQRLLVERATGKVPLEELFLLERTSGTRLEIEPLDAVDPRELLGGSFVFVPTTQDRLINQLDMCAALARSVAVSRLRIPPSAGAEDVAAKLSGRLGLPA